MERRLKTENRLRKARLYQDRAQTVRSLAAREKDPSLRIAMVKLAEDYEEYYKDLLTGGPRSERIIYPN